MEHPTRSVPAAPAVHVVPVSGADRRPTAVVVVTALFLLAAVVKPWGSPGGGGGGATTNGGLGPAVAGTSLVHTPSGSWAAGVSSRAGTSPAAGASPGAPQGTGADRGGCGPNGEWLLLAHESILDRDVVALLAVDGVSATGPLDPAIPFTRLVSPVVASLGFCGPLLPASTTATPFRATVWTVSRGQPVRIVASGWREGVATPYMPTYMPTSSPAATPSTPGGATGGARGWPAGRYVLQVKIGTGAGASSWLGLEIVHPAP